MNKTMIAMERERDLIWAQYDKNRRIYETRMVEKTKCVGFGEFIGTGEFHLEDVRIGERTMEEWDAEKAARYEFLNAELAEWEAEKKRKAKLRRYKEELKDLETRMKYLKKWIAENEG